MTAPVGIVGGGGFGRSLALAAARARRDVMLWSRTPRTFDEGRIAHTSDLGDLTGCEIVFVAVPSPHVVGVAEAIGRHLDGGHVLVHVSRGLLGDRLQTLTQVLRERTAVRRLGALAGPLVADGLAEGTPGGAIVGTVFPEVADAVRAAIGGPNLRVYDTPDLIGVEVASAMVGLVALALGYARGLGLGPGTLAVMATRGVFEAARVGAALGAEERTFSGLAGFGDLIAAVDDDGRPELTLGRGLASGLDLERAGERAGAYVEGTAIARNVASFAERRAIDAPLATVVAQVLDGSLEGRAAVQRLMARPARHE